MWREGLTRRYGCLTLFLAAAAAQSGAALPLRQFSNAYAVVYFVSTPILWLLSYLVVLELYRLILEDYPGISRAGRKGINWCLALAILIAIATSAGSRIASPNFPFLQVFYAVERSTLLGLLLFLVLIQLFLFRYRLRLSPNRIYYSVGFACYFGIGIAADIVEPRLLGRRMFLPLSLALAAVANMILLAGAFLLTREGEARPSLDMADQTDGQKRLQEQLAGMNQLLRRVARGER